MNLPQLVRTHRNDGSIMVLAPLGSHTEQGTTISKSIIMDVSSLVAYD